MHPMNTAIHATTPCVCASGKEKPQSAGWEGLEMKEASVFAHFLLCAFCVHTQASRIKNKLYTQIHKRTHDL